MKDKFRVKQIGLRNITDQTLQKTKMTSKIYENHYCNPFLLQVRPSVRPFVFSVLFIPSFNVFTENGGSFHCLNFNKFCDTAPRDIGELRLAL